MILNITLPDEIFARYADRNPSNPRKEIEKVLERFVAFDPSDRLLIVPKDVRQELEKLIGGPIEKWEKFLSIFKDALSIRAGEVLVPLTEGQVKRLKGQADFYKRDPLEYTTDMVKRGLFAFLGGA
jgi:hypothetical protein